jgi:hypothetical protein
MYRITEDSDSKNSETMSFFTSECPPLTVAEKGDGECMVDEPVGEKNDAGSRTIAT